MGNQQSNATTDLHGVRSIILAPELKTEKWDEDLFTRKGQAFTLLAEMAKEEMDNINGPHQNAPIMIGTIGSREEILIPTTHPNTGLFASAVMAYNFHWAFRTSPDDWWFCVIRKVAKAIDDHSKRESVRRFFVEHEGKKTLEVQSDSLSIYNIDYSLLFDQMSQQISQNIKVPGYVDTLTADFSTTTAVQKLVSQVTVMSSVQEYFNYLLMLKCGIPEVEMLGSEKDWKQLLKKAKQLRKSLKRISQEIGLTDKWWKTVENVFSKLLATYRRKPDRKWWGHIMSWFQMFSSGKMGWEGWLVDFLEGPGECKEEGSMTGGLVTAPLTLMHPSGVTDTAKLVAGMLGFTVHHKGGGKGRPSVEPFQGWSLVLADNSPFRCSVEE